MFVFVDDNFAKEIKQNVISNIFPNLDIDEANELHLLLIKIIENVSLLFQFDLNNAGLYKEQLIQNNYEDVFGFLYILIPHINDNGLEYLRKIRSMNDIYVKKQIDVDINQNVPQYLYSNLQFNRCQRVQDKAIEINFSLNHLKHNYYLLLDTLQKISHRLFINWYQITPHSVDTVVNSQIYHNTFTAHKQQKINDWNYMKDDFVTYNHLYVGNIYESICQGLFHSIKNIKWMIYETKDMITGNLYPVHFILKQLSDNLNYEHITDFTWKESGEKSWEELSENGKELFIKFWKTLLNSGQEGLTIEVEKKSINISKVKIIKILRSISFFFNKYYDKIEEAKDNGYIKLIYDVNKITSNIEDELLEDDEIIELSNITDKMVMKSLGSIKYQYIYDYIMHVFDHFKQTIYAEHSFYDNNNQKIMSINMGNINMFIHLTSKNIYNYAKSFCHLTDNHKYIELSPYWASLNANEKSMIIDRLNNKVDPNTWFNISKYIINEYFDNDINVDKQIIESINIRIYNLVQSELIKSVFTYLVINGTISKFIPFIWKRDTISQIFTDERIEEYNSGYNFLSMKQYNEMYVVNTHGGLSTYIDYLKYSGDDWFHKSTSLSWVSQINLFHHYLNNRIIFVTGGTGIGKSTQIPKLFLYALKMIDSKGNGRIICSQPRKRPTKDNALRITEQMGEPYVSKEIIDLVSTKYDKKFAEYFADTKHHIHFRYHGKEKSENEGYSYNQLNLTLVTDGILLNSINEIFPRIGLTQYKNLYDIVMVDESHEHNTNMDMILTLMKQILYYNNSMKLIIVSATMEDDEPIYRRFYRDINDNKMFPLNWNLEKYNLDRINVDRRLHISGKTPYKINDIFTPLSGTSGDEVTRIINIINQQILTRQHEDILIFMPGRKEILQCVKMINQHTPNNVLAIPYFRELQKEITDFIEIDLNQRENKYKIHVSKNIDFESLHTKEELFIGNSHYDTIIIVATNIAEASITIATLTDVIDNGKQKIAEYDFIKNGSVLRMKLIAETNRIQRRGRVGRTKEGTVYYLYDKEALKGNKLWYKISIDDISMNLFTLLKSTKLPSLFNHENDPNALYHTSIDQLKQKYIDNNVVEFVKRHYYTGKYYFGYVGNKNHYDYQSKLLSSQFSIYQDGLSISTLNDNDGSFHIIHPEEPYIERNILGKIIKVQPKSMLKLENYTVKSPKMELFWDKLLRMYIIINDQITSSVNSSLISSHFSFKKNIIKSLFGKLIMTLSNYLVLKTQIDVMTSEFVIRLSLAYIYSTIYQCEDQMLKLIAILQVTKMRNFSSIVDSPNNFILLKESIGDVDSDCLALIKIIDIVTREVDINKPLNTRSIELIKDKCSKYFVNNLVILETIDILLKIKERLNEFKELNTLKQLIRTFLYPKECQGLILSLLHAFSDNLVKHITETSYYLNITHPSIENINVVEPIFRSKQPMTFVKKIHLTGYLFYLKLNSIEQLDGTIVDKISILSYISPQCLSSISGHIMKKNIISLIDQFQKNYERVQYKELINRYYQTILTIKQDIPNIFIDSTPILKNLPIDYLNTIDGTNTVNDIVTQVGGSHECHIYSPLIDDEIIKMFS